MHHWRMGPLYTPKVQPSVDMLALSTNWSGTLNMSWPGAVATA